MICDVVDPRISPPSPSTPPQPMKTRLFFAICCLALLGIPQQEAHAWPYYWIKVSGNPDGSINCSAHTCYRFLHSCCGTEEQEE